MGGAGNAGVEGFERVFTLVGGHGLFQWKLLAIVSLQLVVLTWHHLGYAFLGSVPQHWCRIPDLKHSNWTVDEIKQISIPRSRDPENAEQWLYQNCEYYHLNYASLLESSSSFEEALSKVDFENATTRKCVKWDYDRSIYQSTVATDFDLVCENRWKAATIQGSYMAAGLVGALTFGSLSDRVLGRRRTVLTSLGFVMTGGILASFARAYWIFVLLRMVISVGVNGCMQNCFILLTEHVDKDYRALISMVVQVAFAVGYMILPGLAYNLRYWNHLQLSFGLISLGLVVYYWILPESPRWLATQGRLDEAIDFLYKMAKWNKMPKPKRQDLMDILKQCSDEHEAEKKLQLQLEHLASLNNTDQQQITREKDRVGEMVLLIQKNFRSMVHNFKKLMHTAEIRKRTFVFWKIFLTSAMVYYGIAFSGNLTSDPFLLVFLGGLMEVPAYTVVVPFISKLGRRPTTVGNFILTGICMVVLTRIPRDYEMVRIVFAMLAKLFVSTAFAIAYLLGAELYPTELRTTGLACGVFMGRIGSISAPYIVDLMQTIYRDLPSLIFGVMAIIGGVVSLLLPETKALEMSDKVTEIEHQADVEKAKERVRKQSWVDVQ